MFPDLRGIGLDYAGVQQLKEHLTDPLKARMEHVNADAVLAADRRAAES